MNVPPFDGRHSFLGYAAAGKPIYPAYIRRIENRAGRDGRGLRPKKEPKEYLRAQLLTPKINKIHRHLWLAGLPKAARPLHRQILLRRSIVITEDPNEHLFWKETRIFIKPLPALLLDHKVWESALAKDDELYRSACGMLWSYSWLINYESDLRIAKENGLVPDALTWDVWVQIVSDFLDFFESPAEHVDQRYKYGELRLSRLTMIYRFSLSSGSGYQRIYGFMPGSTWEKEWFQEHFAWLIAVFAYVTVVLSSMQVGLATEQLQHDGRFQKASYGFVVTSLIIVVLSVGVVPVLWVALFTFHLIFTLKFHRKLKPRGAKVDSAMA